MVKLDEWEKRLRPQMAAIELIGELDLLPEEVDEIGRSITDLTHSQEPQAATRALERSYPSAFAAYLVFQGGHSYDRGDFWAGVCAGAGLPNDGNYTVAWGQAFERITRRFGIQHEFAGHRYVGAMLGHGGIPARSLPDFFEHMLQPSVTKPELAALSTPDLIIEWLDSSAQFQVDKPILRFLEYGGKVAEDFVDRCRRFARGYADEGELPTAAEIGLPESLVNAYQEWIDQPSRVQPVPHSGLRLRKPNIVLDPWGLGMHVVLPEQQIPPTQSLAEMWWEIDAGGTTERVPVSARRVDMDLKTHTAYAVIEGPAAEYRVRFHRRTEQTSAESLRAWVYGGFSPSHPLFAFDPETGVLMPQPKRLPARLLWILCPPDVELTSDPVSESLIQERLPRLPWAWHTWHCYRLNLQGISTLRLASTLGTHSIPVVEVREGLTAELVNASRLHSLEDPVPLFVGAPPVLRIPTRGPDSPEDHLERWRFELTHEWNADPECAIKSRLSDLEDLVQRGEGSIELPLSHFRLLGVSPVGQYRIRLQGPLGRSTELRFRIAPKIYLTGHEVLYLPEPGKGAPTAQLLIETDPQSKIELLQNEPTFRLEELACDEETRCYQVTVPPDRADAPLRLVRHVLSGQSAYIPLRIPIRRLRWLLILNANQLAQPAWQSDPSAINLAELEQSESPYLMLELPVPESSEVATRLCFLDVSGELIAELEAPRPTGSTCLRRFDLRSVRDALRESQSPAVRAELKIEGLPGRSPLALMVLTVRRSITIERATVALRQLDGDQFLDIAWEPEIPLHWRHGRLWCQTRPWAEPISLPVPDEARRSHSYPVSAGTVPAGRYLIEFLVRDPWLPDSAPVRPRPDAPNVATIVIGSLEERLAQLDPASREGSDDFSCACERAFLWNALGQTEQALSSLQECWERLNASSLREIMALVREFQDQPTGKAFRIRLYRTEQIKQVIAASRDGELPESVVATYLAELPPLARLAPQAGEALLDAPDARIQLAAARHLIEQGNTAGIKAAFEWEGSGRLSREGLDELIGLNIPVAIEYIASQLPPGESIRLLRTSDSRDFQFAVARSLVRRDYPEGVLAVIRLCERNAIPSAQAVEALGLSPCFSARVLSEQPPAKTAANLLAELLDAHPSAIPTVHAGVWVHCQVGWAQIDHIEAADGQRIVSLAPDRIEEGVRIAVTFHPGPDAIKALIDTSHKQILLLGVNRVFQCAKCNQYIAVRYDKITGEHERAAHEGRGPTFRPLKSPLRLSGPLEFRHKLPTKL